MKQDDTFSEMLLIARELDAKKDPARKKCRMASGVLAIMSLTTFMTITSMIIAHVIGIDNIIQEHELGKIVYVGTISSISAFIFLKHIFVWGRKKG